jgi:xylan 1,4-beta-xylosidase
VLNGNGTVPVEMTHPTLPLKPFEAQPARTHFDTPQLSLEWNYIQPPTESNFKLNPEKGTLTLQGSALKIGEKGNPTFTGRRLTGIRFEVTTRMEYQPENENEEAGMVLISLSENLIDC